MKKTAPAVRRDPTNKLQESACPKLPVPLKAELQ